MASALIQAEHPPDGVQLAGAVPEFDSAQLPEAFAAFSAAAKSLEQSYFGLGREVWRLRRELAEERDLRRRRETLAEISALLAHEIRNPLGSMELFAGLLAGAGLRGEQREWVEQIRSALGMLSATVNNILEFHSRRPVELSAVEINGLLQSLESLLAPVAESTGTKWIAGLWPHPLWIRADRPRLQQVFLNLALNAFRFAAGGGVLRVSTCKEGDKVTVSFEDKGPGIAPEVLARIFEARVTTSANGSGLGLAIAKHIVAQHLGTISANSALGDGACFQIRLPLVTANEAGAER